MSVCDSSQHHGRVDDFHGLFLLVGDDAKALAVETADASIVVYFDR